MTTAAAATAAALGTHRAGAVPLYWDGSASTTWTAAANWSTDPANAAPDPAAPPGAADVATFNITGLNTAQTVSLDADQAALGLSVVNTGVVTLQGGGTNRTLQLGASGITMGANTTTLNVGSTTAGQNVNVSLTAPQTWSFGGANVGGNGIIIRNAVTLGVAGPTTLTLGGTNGSTAISTVFGVISDGAGVLSITQNATNTAARWNLSGNNTYTGTTTITAGAIGITHPNALGATSAGTTVGAAAGQTAAALFLRSGAGSVAAEPLSIIGAGQASAGALRNVSGDNTWQAPIAVNLTGGNTAIGADSGSLTLTAAADINTTGNGTLVFTNNAANATPAVIVNGDITGAASVSKTVGTGSFLTFGGDPKTYSGPTTVGAGFLTVNTPLPNTGAVAVQTGAILRGTSTINPVATVTVNGTLSPGATNGTVGALAVGPLVFAAAGTPTPTPATFLADVNPGALTSDLVNVTGDLTLDAANNTVLTVNEISPVAIGSGTFTLIDYSGTWTGGLFTVGGTPVADDGTFTTAFGNTYRLDYNAPGGAVTLTAAVPEPTAGLSLLLFAGLCRTRQRRTSMHRPRVG